MTYQVRESAGFKIIDIVGMMIIGGFSIGGYGFIIKYLVLESAMEGAIFIMKPILRPLEFKLGNILYYSIAVNATVCLSEAQYCRRLNPAACPISIRFSPGWSRIVPSRLPA